MALRAKVLQTKAAKFEAKKLQVYQVNKEQASSLDPLLEDVYAGRRPKPNDYEVRRDLVRVFNEIAKEIYGYSKDIPVVVQFGSFVMDLFSNTSDLDLSVNFTTNAVPFPREKKIQTLRKFAKKLYAIQSKGHIYGVLPITTAKVPILKCVDRGTGVECDISVENRDGILKSQLIHIISSIDERFQKLSFLMKTWAKANNINSSKDKTLNSLSIILLVAFHLQTRNPPILPPFSAIFKDGTDAATVTKSLRSFVNYGKNNIESLGELFVTLLIKLSSVEKLWSKGLCASTCDASWTSKTWDSKVASFSVEDFTDRSQNVSRAVGQAEVKQRHKCIDVSIRHIFSFMNGQIGGAKLRDHLFGQDGMSNPITRATPNLHPDVPRQLNNQGGRKVTGKRRKKSNPLVPVYPNRTIPIEGPVRIHSGGWELVEQARQLEYNPAKKMRMAEGWGGAAVGGWGGGVNVGGWGEVQHAAPFGGQTIERQPVAGWGGVHAGGWGGGTQQTNVGGWGGEIQQSSVGGWGGGTQQSNVGEWGGIQQSSVGGWGGIQQSSVGGWGGIQQSSVGGCGDGREPHVGGWGGGRQNSAGGWRDGREPHLGGWGGGRQNSAGGWGGTSDPLRSTEPYYRKF